MRLLRPERRAGALAVAAMALVAVAALLVDDPEAPIPVEVEGSAMTVPAGASVAVVMAVLRVGPEPGDLLAVDGRPLRRGVHPGRILVNGVAAPATTVLRPGDVVRFVDGRDRVEPLARDVVPVPQGGIPNPQSHVGTVPGDQVITRGSISGRVVSSTFRPRGDARPPRTVALTFDDGPSPRYTPRVVRTLRRFDVPATFFMIGYLVERYPDVVRMVRDAGLTVGNHSMHHPMDRPFDRLPPRRMREQIEAGHRALLAAGVEPVAFRPPGGAWSDEVVEVASEVGERTVLWSVDSEDFAVQKPRELAARVVRQAKPGSIVLLHDGGGNRGSTVRALPRIINGLRRKGLDIVGLG